MALTTPDFLQPVAMEDFFSSYWEQQPLHIRRSSREPSVLIDLQRIESVLSTQPVYFPGVQVTHSGRDIEVSSYVDERDCILPMRLFEQYAQGATVILSQAQKLFPELNDLCREVVKTMGMKCQTNVYISPPGKQGFNAHYDTHDVFILQISGSKTFNFYPSSVELPFPEEQFNADKLPSPLTIDESIELQVGDTLYIPRGVVHDAVADSHIPSIHVTLGVYPVLLRDYLDEVMRSVLLSNAEFRRSAAAFTHSPCAVDVSKLSLILSELVDDIKSTLGDTRAIDTIRSRLLDELALDSLQDCRGLSHSLSGNAFDETGSANFRTVVVNTATVASWEKMASGVKIRSHGQIIEFKDAMAVYVSLLLEKGRLGASELSILTVEQRLAVILRLRQGNIIYLE